jgi:serine/threonine protein kinase/Leucine-rich repeat (LRR) protein
MGPGDMPRPMSQWICPTCGLQIPTTSITCPQDGTSITTQLRPDTSLSNNYEFIGTIGHGGMSIIYKARQIALNKLVAIKMLHSHLLTEQSMRRFEQEARTVSSLKHPNIPTVYDFGISEQGQPYMVMDFIDGITLAQLLKEHGSLLLPEAMDIFIGVAGALEHAHEHGILHRDLKPSNIMLGKRPDGEYAVYLVDFGIAKLADSGPGSVAQQLTNTGEVLGSPLYMSPEQCMGKNLSQTSDIYSFGCILYEAVVGFPPHCGATVIETVFGHLNEAARPLEEARPDISFPQAFEDLTLKLLRTDPAERYQSMSEVKEALLDIQGGALTALSVDPTPTQVVAKAPLKISKHMIIGAISATAVVFSLVLLAMANNVYQQALDENSKSARKLREAQELNDGVRRVRQQLSQVKVAEPAIGKKDATFEKLMHLDPSRKDVYLQDTNVNDAALPALVRLKQLAYLGLNGTKITDLAINPLVQIPSLTTLELNDTKLSAKAIARLASLPNLAVLKLDGTATDDSDLLALSKMPNLNTLDVSDTAITDKGLAYLAKAPKLTHLSINGTDITNKGLEYLAHSKMTSIDMWDTKASSGALEILKDCKNLQRLTVSRLKLSKSDLAALSGFKALYYLQLHHIHNLMPGDVQNLVGLKSLGELYIDDCPITDADAGCFSQMTQLTILGLSRTKITDQTLMRITNLQRLKKLWLQESNITDAGANAISKLKNLESLYIQGSLIGDKGLMDLVRDPNLWSIEAQFCPNISRRGLSAAKKAKPGCWINLNDND